MKANDFLVARYRHPALTRIRDPVTVLVRHLDSVQRELWLEATRIDPGFEAREEQFALSPTEISQGYVAMPNYLRLSHADRIRQNAPTEVHIVHWSRRYDPGLVPALYEEPVVADPPPGPTTRRLRFIETGGDWQSGDLLSVWYLPYPSPLTAPETVISLPDAAYTLLLWEAVLALDAVADPPTGMRDEWVARATTERERFLGWLISRRRAGSTRIKEVV